MAVAMKGEQRDNKRQMDIVEIIRNDLMTVAKSLGGKIRKKKQSQPAKKLMDEDRIPTLKEALAMLGGNGTVITYNKGKK